MELNQPDFANENVSFCVSEVREFTWDLIHGNSSFIISISYLDLCDQVINESSEVRANW